MTLRTAFALFGAMFVLALIPGPGVFAVVARSMSSGFRHGAITTLGIVAGDYVFIVLTVSGLVALANTMGSFFVILKYLGAAYLIWLAISLWRAEVHSGDIQGVKDFSFISNFLTGLFTTLGNPKAILFYIGFFPTFLDLSTISVLDVSLILFIATIAIGSVKLGYAFVASNTRRLISSPRAQKSTNRVASCIMACSGILLAVKS